ncbi:hypothetical protein RM780_13870 [Streptomyces sp. DSM 44917]|uniref:Uncharacterized protein n=1 Tax=Streptomyces boetiae TaxID=3075541 RepID=A0ABU2L8Z4_9ACTN|nr:hypothetical protein [Streptomyces sp. DSM 44917]MDT0308043.1 hypothetical protein [Streptomyces sp. DSM 44917]
MELSRELVAVALFVQPHAMEAGFRSDDESLLEALAGAVAEYGVAGLAAELPGFEALPVWDRRAGLAWGLAHRLCLAFWYADALSAPMDAYQVAAGLYASGLAGGGTTHVGTDPAREAQIAGHLAEGISRLGARQVAVFGGELERHFNRHSRTPERELDAAFRAAMPDRRRRRFCYDLAVNYTWARPVPLMVWFNAGGAAIGTTPPPCPHEAAHHAHVLREIHAAQGAAA